ncbi:NifB/NifX family molybdenum-iron cluster-binding protein [candidate division KSB1 bacterium]
MKIAVASSDGVKISKHFGRSKCFIVYEIDDNRITGHEVRQNSFTPHAQGKCNHGNDQHHNQPHSHEGIISALKDCEGVISFGMGWRAAEDLRNNNIKSYILDQKCGPEHAVILFLQDFLKESDKDTCCSGKH